MITQKIMSSVADPRFQPRRSRRLTAGSSAKATNNETSNNNRKLVNLWNVSRITNVPRNPSQKMMTARQIQRGIFGLEAMLLSVSTP
jgi:hypothetical protein